MFIASILKMCYICINMSQDRLIKIINKSTGTTVYTTKNKKKVTRKIELKKYDPVLRKHVTFKEAKK